MAHSYPMWHDSFVSRVTWLIYTPCDMTHSYPMWHDSFVSHLTQLIRIPCDMTHLYPMWHDSLALTHSYPMCDMTHPCPTWHYSFISLCMYSCAMTHSQNRRASSRATHHVYASSFICVPWLIHICAKTHSHVYHDSFTSLCTHAPWLIHRITAWVRELLLLLLQISLSPFIRSARWSHFCRQVNTHFFFENIRIFNTKIFVTCTLCIYRLAMLDVGRWIHIIINCF